MSAATTTEVAPRVLAALPLFALLALGYWAMWRGWRRRAARDTGRLTPAPPPADPGALLAGPAEGTYLGSTTAGSWLDRVTAHRLGRRGRCAVAVHEHGVLVDRVGEDALWLPRDTLDAVRLDRGAAGRVFGDEGVVVVTWAATTHGPRLDTGLRLRHAADTQVLAGAVGGLLPAAAERDRR